MIENFLPDQEIQDTIHYAQKELERLKKELLTPFKRFQKNLGPKARNTEEKKEEKEREEAFREMLETKEESSKNILTEREKIEIRETQSITPDQFIRLAEYYIGAIYNYGSVIGEGYSKEEKWKTDCSGFIYGILKMVGIRTKERSTIFQYPISEVLYDPDPEQRGKKDKSIGQKGDLIFWFGIRESGEPGTTHVAFIEENLGGGVYQTIEAASSLDGVGRTIRDINPKEEEQEKEPEYKIVRYPYIKKREEQIVKESLINTSS